MDTKALLVADFTAIEKRYKKGKDKELTPVEKQFVADEEAARTIVKKCCASCANMSTEEIQGKENGLCGECYSIYDHKIKRFWLARYKRKQ